MKNPRFEKAGNRSNRQTSGCEQQTLEGRETNRGDAKS